MDIVSMLSEHWVEIAAAVYLLGMIINGHRKGFIRLAVSATALLITLVAVNYAQPHVIDWLKYDTSIYETMKEKMAESVGIDEILERMELDGPAEKADEWMIIEDLPIPQQLKDLLVENNNIEVYRTMGVEFFRDYIGGYLADLILKAVVFIVLFLVVYMALQVVVLALDLIAKLPIINGINKIAGAALGGAEALLVLWIAGIFLTAFSGTELGSSILSQVYASPWLSWIYDHNILSIFTLGLIRNVW